MLLASIAPPPTIAGHTFVLTNRATDILNLRIALGGAPIAELARALAKLEGVRVTDRLEGAGHARCYLVHCLGFQMILAAPGGEAEDCAVALVSRTPQAALAVVSDLGNMLDRLMSEPPAPAAAPEPAGRRDSSLDGMRTSSGLRRSVLQGGQPLARRTELRRKTPMARGPFKRR
jgi:hypothetical protein